MTPNQKVSAVAAELGREIARLREKYGDVAVAAMARQTGGADEWVVAVEKMAAVSDAELAEFPLHPADWVALARVADEGARRKIIGEYLSRDYACDGMKRLVDEHLEAKCTTRSST